MSGRKIDTTHSQRHSLAVFLEDSLQEKNEGRDPFIAGTA